MRVVIVGKTHMETGVCVGGILLPSNRSVRLIPVGRINNPQNTDYEVGQIWDIDFHHSTEVDPPHTEDINVTRGTRAGNQADIRDFLIGRVNVHTGAPGGLYEGLLGFTANGSGYIAHRLGVPNYSTCFWVPDRPLHLRITGVKRYYHYQYANGREVRFAYVGFQQVEPILQQGTLIRMSLARWWHPEDDPDFEDRCYVQLSGWFR